MWKNKPGYFMTIEGPEGGGKTTQIPKLVEYLRDEGLSVIVTREPGGTSISDQIREIIMKMRNTEMLPRTETLLFQASRAQLIGEMVSPRLKAGYFVLCDRFSDSTFAYQGYAHGQDLNDLRSLVNYATNGLSPDLTILFDIDVEKGLRRRREGGGEWNRLDAAQLEFHMKVREGYLKLVEAEPDRWIVIDAGRDKDGVLADLKREVVNRLTSDGYVEGGHRGPER
jgi:dTMP kinase